MREGQAWTSCSPQPRAPLPSLSPPLLLQGIVNTLSEMRRASGALTRVSAGGGCQGGPDEGEGRESGQVGKGLCEASQAPGSALEREQYAGRTS